MPIGTVIQYSKETVQESLRLRYQGVQLKDVAERTGISKHVVTNIMFKRKIYQDFLEDFLQQEQISYDDFIATIRRHNQRALRAVSSMQSFNQRHLSKEQAFQVFDYIFNQQYTMQRISKELNISIHTVKNIRYSFTYSDWLDDYFKARGIVNRTPYYQMLSQTPHVRNKVNEQSIRTLFASYLSGSNIQKASQEAGFSTATAKRLFNVSDKKWAPFVSLLLANEGFTKKSFAEYRRRKNRKIHQRNAMNSFLIQSHTKK